MKVFTALFCCIAACQVVRSAPIEPAPETAAPASDESDPAEEETASDQLKENKAKVGGCRKDFLENLLTTLEQLELKEGADINDAPSASESAASIASEPTTTDASVPEPEPSSDSTPTTNDTAAVSDPTA